MKAKIFGFGLLFILFAFSVKGQAIIYGSEYAYIIDMPENWIKLQHP